MEVGFIIKIPRLLAGDFYVSQILYDLKCDFADLNKHNTDCTNKRTEKR
jgi:hypothetical protein